jgi:CspA family cold shock protein
MSPVVASNANMNATAEPGIQRETGTVLWFNEKKGFGFIKPDDAGADLFVHVSDVVAAGLAALGEQQRVSFQRDSHGDGRFYATRLALLSDQAS